MVGSSLKNIIVVSDSKVLKKIFNDEQDFYTEKCFYEEFAEFEHIPKLVGADDNALLLEYIKGRGLYECSLEEQLLLAVSLGKFHKETFNIDEAVCLTHHDTNLNNYIYAEGVVIILDFSDIAIDSPLCDVYSALLFFAELYEPEEFFRFCDKFFESYFESLGTSLKHSEALLKREIKRFETRREELNKCIDNYHWYLQNIKNLLALV